MLMCKCYDGNFTDFIHEDHIYKTVLKTNKSESASQSIPERREPDRMSEYRERKPTSKGLLAQAKCQQRNARTRERDSFSLSQAS